MSNELMIFEGNQIEVLTKEDVNFQYDGDVLFNGVQCASILGYVNQNRDIERHCDDESIYLITEEKLSTEMVLSLKLNTNLITLGQRGTKFLTEDGVFDLIYNSNLPKAKEFKKKVKEIVKTVQRTGKFDSVEQQLKLIEDEKERNLSLSLYALEQAVKANPNDMLTVLNYNQTKQQLDTYKQEQRLSLMTSKVDQLQETIQTIKQDTELIKGQQVYVCNRTNFFEKVTILANKYFARDIQEAYKRLYLKMKVLGSFDVYAHRKHEWEAINAEREKKGKKPYKNSTLSQKFNMLDVIDKYNKWSLCSEAYKTVETEMYDKAS